MTGTFDEETGLTAAGPGRWTGHIHRSWWVQRGPNGGFVAAVILRGLQLAVDDATRHPRSLTVHYLRAPEEGEVELEVSVERAGRSLTTLSARLLQGGQTMALALGALAADRASSVGVDDAVLPTLLPESERPDLGPVDQRPPVTSKWRTVPAIGGSLRSGGPAESGGLIRLAEHRPLDALAVAAAMDGWVPPIFIGHVEPVGVPTVDLTIHFLRPLPHAGTDAETDYICRFVTDAAAGGHLLEEGELWAPDGTLLARSRQLAVTLG